MAIVSQGSLSEYSAPRLFAALAGRAFTGEMVVAAGGREFRVAWEGGAIVGARSPHPADSAAKIAVTLGVLSSTQAGEVARLLASTPGHDEVDVVSQVARLSTELIGRLVRRIAGARASRALSPDAGEFTVLDELPYWGNVAPVDARWVLYNGIRTHLTIERIARELATLGDMFVLREDPDITGFGFGSQETIVLERLSIGALPIAPVPPELDAQIATSMALALLLTGEAKALVSARPPAPAAPKPVTPPAVKPVTPAIPKPVAKEGSKPVPAPVVARPVPAPVPVPTKPPVRAVRRAAANADQIRTLVNDRLALLNGGADHFKLLDVAMDASPEEIRQRYFALARNLHPDRLEAAGIADEKKDAQRLFAKMNEAFTTLTDPDRRHAYTQIQKAGGEVAVKAREAATEAAVRKALDAEERFRLGEMALRRQQLEIAVREFQKALELNPEESDHHAMLGWALYVAAPNKTAVVPSSRGHLLAAIDRNKKNPMPHLYLGRIARMENNLAEAEKHLMRALELAPNHTEATAELRAVQAARPSKPPDTKGGLFSRLKKP
ncbi:MAG TPA: DnaJ domain-containing protein [Kofleriaceae bacterium]|nr:DnaJ domain-containing protein [Kofleriaceae bacterium]